MSDTTILTLSDLQQGEPKTKGFRKPNFHRKAKTETVVEKRSAAQQISDSMSGFASFVGEKVSKVMAKPPIKRAVVRIQAALEEWVNEFMIFAPAFPVVTGVCGFWIGFLNLLAGGGFWIGFAFGAVLGFVYMGVFAIAWCTTMALIKAAKIKFHKGSTEPILSSLSSYF